MCMMHPYVNICRNFTHKSLPHDLQNLLFLFLSCRKHTLVWSNANHPFNKALYTLAVCKNAYANTETEAYLRHVYTDSNVLTTSCEDEKKRHITEREREREREKEREKRYEKMPLLILDYLIWLVTVGPFILRATVVTFMVGRSPSKGLRAWQKHWDGDCDWGQDNAGADWVWDLWELVKPCGASGGLGFSALTHSQKSYANASRRVCVSVFA